MDSQERLSDFDECGDQLSAWVEKHINTYLDAGNPPIPVFMLFSYCLVSELHARWDDGKMKKNQSARIVAGYDELMTQSDQDWVSFGSIQQFVRKCYRQAIRGLAYADKIGQTKVLNNQDTYCMSNFEVLSRMCMYMTKAEMPTEDSQSFNSCRDVISVGIFDKIMSLMNLRYPCYMGTFELDFEHSKRFVSRLLEISKLPLPPSQCFPLARKEWELFRANDKF